MEILTSTQNPKIKHLLALREKSRLRREEGIFIVEGRRELEHCIESGYETDTVFAIDPSIVPEGLKTIQVSEEVYAKIACREGTEGIVAEVRSREMKLSDIECGEAPLFIVLESVEKPGNLGAVLRTADAAGATAVIVCDPLTDLYNPNLIRSSIGAVFTVPTIACSSEEAIDYFKRNGIQILTAQLQDSSLYYDRDMTCGTAIVMGTEATGLTEIWRKAADAHVRIPMLGKLDSLNVSVSAAILTFEAVRQRTNKAL